MKLNNLQPQFGAKKKSFRKGRGPGSGNGKTGGRGNNGDRARSGYKHKRSFEGGQNPLQRRLPKRGFVSLREGAQEVQLSRLVNLEATAIDANVLAGAGLIGHASKPVKIIGNSALSKAISFKVDAVTAGARAAIEAAGGKVELIAEAN